MTSPPLGSSSFGSGADTGQSENPSQVAVEGLLKQHRIRRVDTETVLRTLRAPAIKVADGVTEAAYVHMRSLVVRLHVVNRELKHVEHKLDELCARIEETGSASGECVVQRDVAILKSLPGIGRINSRSIARRGLWAAQPP